MARVRMLEAHDFTPDGLPMVRIAFRKGRGYTIKHDWATQLEFLGKAVREEPPARPPEDAPRRSPRARRARRAKA